ncbi:MAG: hypothetical protein ACRDPY_16320 [Streptosporangiaceae bacterium]
MIVDTGEFRALKEQVATNEARIEALSEGLVRTFAAAGRPVPLEMRGPRHARPRDRRLRVVGGQR